MAKKRAHTPHTPKPEAATKQTAIWVETELLDWIDAEALRRDRSRAYIINEALRKRRSDLERRRKR